MPLPDVNILKSANDDFLQSNPARFFPENLVSTSSSGLDGGEPTPKSSFLSLTPNEGDGKIYANTPNYYQPKDVPNRYKRFVFGIDNESVQADIQSGWDRVGNAAANFGEKIGAYLVQTAGFIGGAIPAAIGGIVNYSDKALGGKGEVVNKGNAVSLMTDNLLTNLGESIKENVQETNPIYKSAKYTQGSIWQKLGTTSWWLDDAVDRAALTVSMIIPGIAEARGVGLFGSIAEEAGTIRATGLLSKGIQELADNPELYGKIGKALGNQIYKTAVDGTVDIGSNSALANRALAFKNTIQKAQAIELYSWNVIGQSALNGKEAQTSIRRALYDQREQGLISMSDDEIEKKAAEGAAKGFWYTAPLALVGSLIELPQIFSTAKMGQSALKKFFNPNTLEVLENAAKTVKPSFYKIVRNTLFTGLEHGQNESAQVAIGRYLEESIAGTVKGGRIIKDEQNPFIAITKNWVDNVNDPNGQNNIALGTIQGMLMTLLGHGGRVLKGTYAKEDAQNKRYIETINNALTERRYWSTPDNFMEKDDSGKIKLHPNGSPVFNENKLVSMGMSLVGMTNAWNKRTEAVKNNDQKAIEELQYSSLAALSKNFFDDPNGMEYLTNLLRFETKNQKSNINRVNDVVNGIEYTPDRQLEENLQSIEKLKKAHDAIENRHAGFTSIEIDNADKNEVNLKAGFIENHKQAQYSIAAKQLFLNNRIEKNNIELGSLGISEFTENPTTPQEERANDIIKENEDNVKELDEAKDTYKFLTDKTQFKSRFNTLRDEYRKTKQRIETAKDSAAQKAVMTPEELQDANTIKVTTKKGEQNVVIGEEYYLGKVIEHDVHGNEVYRFPKLTILGENPDGTIQIKGSDGIERAITKDVLLDYKLGKVADVAKNENASFYMRNMNNIVWWNTGKSKLGKVPGRLVYDSVKDKLSFVYVQKGKVREVEIGLDSFEPKQGYDEGVFTLGGTLTKEDKIDIEKRKSSGKTIQDQSNRRTTRLKMLNDLFNETSDRLTTTKTLLQQKYSEFEKVVNDLLTLETKIKKGELSGRNNFKSTTNKAIKAANRLSRMQEQLRLEIQELEAEQDTLDNAQAYIADMAQNIDELPTDSREFLNELKDQQNLLESLHLETGIQINSLSKIIDSTDAALDSAINMVRELISKFEKAYPKSPTAIIGQTWVDFLQANPNFLKLKPNFKADLAIVEDILAQIEDLDIIPGERTVKELREQLEGLQNQLKDIEEELAAKQLILDKFEGIVKLWEKSKEEETKISKNEELIKAVLGTLNQTVQNKVFEKPFQADSKKSNEVVTKATIFPTERSENGETPAEHHLRANRFGARFPKLKNRSSIRGVIVTSTNEAKLIPGLTEFLKQGKTGVDVATTITLVMVEKDTEGNIHLVDENGERITDVKDALNKGIFQVFPLDIKDMFREGTEKYVVDGLSKQYEDWRKEQLAEPEAIDYNIAASFGIPETVKKLDEQGNPLKEEDYTAQTPITETGLISESDLKTDTRVYIPTLEGTTTQGTTSFKNSLGAVFLRTANGDVPLNNRKHTSKEASAIYDAIYRLSTNIIADGNIKSEESQRLLQFLRSVVFWGSPKDGKNSGYNSVWFDKIAEDGKFKLFMSGKNTIVSEFTPTELENNKGNILALLQEMYSNTNSKLTESDWKKLYEQIISISKDGKIEKKTWENYQTYLLSNKDANGKTARKASDIPLTTRIRPLKNAEDVNKKGVYFIINDEANDSKFVHPEVPKSIVITPGAPKANTTVEKEVAKPTTIMTPTQNFVLDGTTENTITLADGNTISFKYDDKQVIEPEGLPTVSLTISPGANKALVDKKKAQGIDITEDDVKSAYYAYIISKINAFKESIKTPTPEVIIETPMEDKPVEAPKSANDVSASIKSKIEERKKNVKKDVDLREFVDNLVGQFEKENWTKVEAFIKATFPNIPIYRVKNMLQGVNGLQAWGMLKDGAIYIYENAEVGTAYHEIFEAVWKLAAPASEQTAVLNEFKNRKGSFIERTTGKSVNYSDATPSQIKEQLAEEFRDFVHEGKIPPKPIDSRPYIVKLFSDLVNMIKSLFIGKAGSKTERLFKDISKGRYKTYVPTESTLSYANKGIIDINNAYITESADLRERVFPGLTNENIHDMMQQMTFVTLNYVMEDNENLFNIQNINKEVLYERLKENLEDRIVQQIVAAEDAIKEGKDAQHIIDNSEMLFQNIENNWKDLRDKHEEYLKTYSIEFDENDELALTDENKGLNDVYGDADKIDHFRKANSAIKLLLATLPKVDNKGTRLLSSIGGVKLIPMSEAYMAVLNNIHDAVNEDVMIERVRQMAIGDKNYERLYTRLTKSPSKTSSIDWDGFNKYDLKLLMAFCKTFDKQNPDVKLLNILANGDVQVMDSNLSSAARQVKYGFVNDIRTVIRDVKNPYFKYDKTKEYIKKLKNGKDPFDNIILNDIPSRIAFLKSLGIVFSQDEVTRMSLYDVEAFRRFNTATSGILSSMKATDKIATISGQVLSIDGRLLTLGEIRAKIDNPEFSSTYYGVKGERIQTYLGTNPSSDLFKTLTSLKNINELTTNPRYSQYSYLATDSFAKNSIILKSIFESETGDRISQTQNLMKASFADGMINQKNGKRRVSAKETYKERIIQEINMNLEGYHYNLVPGDASLEWMTYMGIHITEASLLSGWEAVHDVFKGYLIDEINLSRENRSIVTPKNTKRDTKDLRFLKSILEDKSSNKPNELHDSIIKNLKDSPEKIYEDNKSKIDNAVEKFIKKETESFKNTLFEYKVISKSLEGDDYTTTNLKFNNSDTISKEDIDRNLNALSTNYIINNIELHKLLYSDPYQYSDELKRIKNFLSPRQNMIYGSTKLNAAINRIWNDGIAEDDIAYTDMNRTYFRTAVMEDVLGEQDLPGYQKALYEETDGSGIIMFKSYRNFRIRTSDWNDAEESQYRYDMAWEKRFKNIPLTESDINILEKGNPSIKSAYTAKKPIVAGNKMNGKLYNDVMLDKFAIYPLSLRILHEVAKKDDKGKVIETNIMRLHNKMQKENIDYVIFQSGRKVGAEKTNALYNHEDGSFNSNSFEGITNVPFAIMSVQSEVPSKESSLVSRGTQMTKEITMDFMEAGVPIDFIDSKDSDEFSSERYDEWYKLNDEEKAKRSPLYKEIINNQNLLEEMIEVGYQNLLKKLGIKDLNGKFEITDYSQVTKTLRKEILKREINDNIGKALSGYEKGDVVFEATPAYQQIRNILYSLADKNIISQKITGGMFVQIPSTLFEANRIKPTLVETEDGPKNVYTSDILNFYIDEDGKRTCEIMIARWFDSNKTDEELLHYFNNTEEGKKQLEALTTVAFRIPTQKQNSIESIKIKKFLPREFGDNVIVPAAIVKKTGGDFDIDKLTTYLKNLYVGRDGYPRLIKFLTDENSTPEERYVHWVRENSNRDTRNYIKFLSRDAVQNLKSNFEIEAAKIKAKYQAIKKDNSQDLFDDMQSDIYEQKQVQLAAQDSYMEELFDMGKRVFWRMTDTTRESFWSVKRDIRQKGIKGPEEIRRYLSLATGMIQDSTTVEQDIVKLEGLQKIYKEELKVMGIMEETINKIVKDAVAAFRENKKVLDYALKIDKSPEFEGLGDIYQDAKSQQSFEGAEEIANMDGLAEFNEFKTFSKYKQNVEKSLQNAYIESSFNLVSSKENFEQLTKPNSADQMKKLAKEITKLRGLEAFDYTSVGNMLNRNFMNRLRNAFVSGRYAIGIAAIAQTNHSLNQRQPIYFDFSKIDSLNIEDAKWLSVGNRQINFIKEDGSPAYNTILIDGKRVPTLSMIKTINGQHISDIVAQFIDGYVDISKGPWIMELGATPNVAGTFLVLAKLGVPIDTISYFMNQPIIRDYLHSIESSGYSYLFMDSFVKDIKSSDKYKDGAKQLDKINSIPNNTELRNSIKSKKLTPEQQAEQHFMLDEFLKYAKMGEQLLTVTQGTNFDTANLNDPYLVFKKMVLLMKAQQTIISSPDDILENSFLGKLANKIGYTRNALATILMSDQSEIRNVLEDILREYVDMPDREFVSVSQKVVSDFFDWAVQLDGNRNTFIKKLLIDDGNGSEQISNFKKEIAKDPSHPLYNNYVIGKNGLLSPEISDKEGGVNNLNMLNKGNKVYDQNQIIYSFREIRDYLKETGQEKLYKTLVGTSVLQSGLSTSRISFTQLLPYEDFKSVYNDTLSNIKNLSNINIMDFKNLNVFERNNWADSDIVPRDQAPPAKLGAMGQLVYNTRMNWFGNKINKKVSEAINKGKLPPLLKVGQFTNIGRGNFVVYSWENMRLSRKEKTEMKKIGDYSYINKGLFKKVYYPDGSPVTTSYTDKKTGDIITSYVYKMINAWGDSLKANEFYNVPKASVIDNGFTKVEDSITYIDHGQPFGIMEIKNSPERSDEIVASYFSTDDTYDFAPKELLEDYSQKTGQAMGTETQPTQPSISVKPGVQELFDSNPELANQVYESLGFNLSNINVEFNKQKNRISVILKNDKNEAKIDIDVEGNYAHVTNTNVLKAQEGFGTLSYIKLANELKKQGLTLTSDINGLDLLESGKTLWESLVRKKLATYSTSLGRYIFTGQQALQQYSQYLESLNKPNTNTESLKTQITELEQKKKTKGISPSEMATLNQLQTELGKIIKSQC